MGALSGGVRKKAIALAILTSALSLVVACATSQPPDQGAAGLVQDVRVDRSEDGRIITLIGLENVSYTSFATSDPSAVVVDLARVGGSATRIPVYDGMVEQVTLSPYSKFNGDVVTRVEVTTSQDVDFDIVQTADGLALRLRPGLGTTASADSPAAAGDDPWGSQAASDAADPWAEPVLGASQDADTAASGYADLALEAPSEARELTGVHVEVLESSVLIHLEADGAIGVTERFSLTDPDRFVLDLPGLTTQIAGQSFPVDTPQVKQVRVGSHSGSVRIVIDGGPEADGFAGRNIRPSRDGLFVGLGNGPELADAIARAVMNADDEARRALVAAMPPAVLIRTAEEHAFAPEATSDQTQAFEEPLDTAGLDESPTAEASEPAEATDIAEVAEAFAFAEETEAIESVDEINEIEAFAFVDEAEAIEAAEATEISELAETIAPPASHESGTLDATDESGVTELIESSDPVQIFGINYDSQEAVDRIVVLSDHVVDYALHTPDPETIVVSIRNAVVVAGAAGRISTQPGAPISMISTFQQPDVEGDEVRVVVKRAAGLMPVVTRRGTILFIDFPNDGEAAAPPPAFSDLAFAVDPAPSAGSELVAQASGSADGSGSQSDARDANDANPDASSAPEFAPVARVEPKAPSEPQAEPVDPWQGIPAEVAPASGGEVLAAASQTASTPTSATSPEAPAALAPPAAVAILQEGGLVDGKEYRGRRISLDFNNVPVEDVLRLIAEVSDLNVIAGDEVKGNVTIRMMDVPWDQALDIVLLTKGLGFIRIGNVLRIAPSDVLKAEAEVRLQERRNLERLEDLIVKLQPINYADVDDASALVSRLLSERGSVIADVRTSTLIIKDIPTVVDEAVALLKAIDTQTPQVLIEAKIVEANLDFSRELGTEWAIGTQPFVNAFDTGSAARQDLGGQDFRLHGNNSIAFSNPINAIPTAAGSLSAFLLDEKLNLEVRLQAQESSGEGKVISSPRIVTMDNREAVIEQGVSIPFQTFEQGDAKLEFIDAVLSLKVTPHITADRSIIMKLEITRNAPDSSIPTTTGTTAIAKNAAKTETLVGDGQTLVLGGIYTIGKTVTHSQVPYLHRIPILGGAFKSKRVRDERKELLIFVTPRILADVKQTAVN